MGFFSRRTSAPKLDIDPAGPTYSDPNKSEIDWMMGHLQFASELGVNIDDLDEVSSFYDTLLQSWIGSPAETRSNPNGSINIIGTVVGEHLVRRTPMAWVVATDSFGTALAVHDAASDVLVYPANAVAKRWAAKETGLFIGILVDEITVRVGPK